MRFIHTADWHLGRLFHGVHLTDDQHHALTQFTDIVKDSRPDAVLIAGDIYDRAIPPPEAVELLDEVLCRLVIDLAIPVILIAGNHDSPQRLNFGSRLMANRKLYVTGNLPRSAHHVPLPDGHGPVHVYPLPYAEPMTARECLNCDDITDHNSAMRGLVARINAAKSHPHRTILIAHAFVAGGAECESERPLSVGGAGTVDAATLDGFDYVALGHLHAPQRIGHDAVRYSGSLLKYSFDEADHAKGVCLVDMDAQGQCDVQPIPLSPRRDVRRIKGLMSDLLRGPADGKSPDDYLEVTLLDEGPVLDAPGRLRAVYPNVMNIRRPDRADGPTSADRPDIRGKSPLQLFGAFYKHVTSADLSPDQEKAFVTTLEEVARREREAAAPAAANPPAPRAKAKPQPVTEGAGA